MVQRTNTHLVRQNEETGWQVEVFVRRLPTQHLTYLPGVPSFDRPNRQSRT